MIKLDSEDAIGERCGNNLAVDELRIILRRKEKPSLPAGYILPLDGHLHFCSDRSYGSGLSGPDCHIVPISLYINNRVFRNLQFHPVPLKPGQ